MKHIAIVGGGITGLALGVLLGRRRVSGAPVQVSVFESASQPGGLIRSQQVDGFLLEHGPTGFLDRAPATLALIELLKLKGRVQSSQDRARRRYIYRDGKLRALPSSPRSLFTSNALTWRGRIRLCAEPLIRRAPSDADESVHQFAARRFGAEAASVLGDAMVSGIFAGDARRLSMRACFPSLVAAEREHGSVVRGALARSRVPKRQRQPRGFGRLTSFPGGMIELVDALASALGPALHLGTPVERLEVDNGRHQLGLADGSQVAADAVVFTGGTGTASLLARIDDEAARELSEIPSAPLVTISLGYRADAIARPLDGFGFLAARQSGLRVLGALWESSIFEHRAPAGHVLLRVMMGGATDPGVVDEDDDALVALARQDLRSAMQVTGDPVMMRLVRHRPGIPQYVTGHVGRVAHIESRLLRRGLFVGGHLLHGVGVNACIEDAAALADCVPAWFSGPDVGA